MTLATDSEVRILVICLNGNLNENSGAPGGPQKWVLDLIDWGFSDPQTSHSGYYDRRLQTWKDNPSMNTQNNNTYQ